MSNYTVYQCSVCRRTKDVPTDNIRATPNYCTITKGCIGKLMKVGETSIASVTPSKSGLVDWYPRGQSLSTTASAPQEQLITLASSSTGAVVMAIYQTYAQMLSNEVLKVKFSQRRLDEISYQQFVFRPATQTSSVSGRDSTGKNLRFDNLAISENRILVRVNGVVKYPGNGPDEIALEQNIVNFNSPVAGGSVVDVLVYAEKDTVDRVLSFTANHISSSTLTGAWDNIRWIQNGRDAPDTTTSTNNKWWIYTCSDTTSITSSSRLRLEGVFAADGSTPVQVNEQLDYVRFLLSAPPHEATDRYLNFYIDSTILKSGYYLVATLSTFNELFANDTALVELYPPMQIIHNSATTASSYISADVNTSTTTIKTDTALSRLTGKKIIGPI